ncbi:hypothetical protein [Streptomyces halobius]|uniref:Uncharacterized protein n=1 Tax=Streptomyces halobius TaxID=2879846 RepID=A0ABY4M3Z0_9ACTN|nr:hypothetical protein [Streptomyces halobius]UQA91968.1 hypothetical protein K9S39_08990 [Streptomyces halobius]
MSARSDNHHPASGHGIHRRPVSRLARPERRVGLARLPAPSPALRRAEAHADAVRKEHSRPQGLPTPAVAW